MELKDYWNTIRKRWRIVLLTFLTTIAVAAVVTFQMTPQYSSTAGIFVSTSQSDESSAYTGNLFATQRVTSYAKLVGQGELAEAVSEELGGKLDADTLSGQV